MLALFCLVGQFLVAAAAGCLDRARSCLHGHLHLTRPTRQTTNHHHHRLTPYTLHLTPYLSLTPTQALLSDLHTLISLLRISTLLATPLFKRVVSSPFGITPLPSPSTLQQTSRTPIKLRVPPPKAPVTLLTPPLDTLA